MLPYNIKGTGMDISLEVRSYVEKRLARFEKLIAGGKPVQLDIELQYEPGAAGQKCRAEYTLAQGGGVVRAEARGERMNEAIDKAADELVRVLRSEKGKRLHLLRHYALRMKEFARGFRPRP